jgi:hypothetical protein
MLEWMYPIVIVAGFAIVLLSYLTTNRLCGKFRDDLEQVSRFDTPRDRVLSHVVFFAVLIGSLATPFICAVLMA